ncbi:HNH endonuclease [Candidatus Saccharibacteria bacterium]|nr:HNH endonuclease [Candidatus Saccharibacteria bacterium]
MTKKNYKARQSSAFLILLALIAGWIVLNPNSYEEVVSPIKTEVENPLELENPAPLGVSNSSTDAPLAREVLEQLAVKGRAAKTGYARTEFYNSWPTIDGCSLRQRIIKREMGDSAVVSSEDNCTVISGEFDEPYTGSHLIFYQKSDFSSGIQIDHVVALSDAWQKGAQNLTKEKRYELATDPLNLLAVDAKTNQAKSDGDAATWLPANKKFRCAYVARQVSVKFKYELWVSSAEKSTIERVLETCPDEPAVGVSL